MHGNRIKVQISAPPVDGAANEAVIKLLAKWLDVPRRSVEIVRGTAGRQKEIVVASAVPELLLAKIESILGPE